MPPLTTAIIIGAGIAGPASALALRRIGVDTVICEAHPEPADHVGSFLNTASNGIAALDQLDLADTIEQAGVPTPRMQFWSGTGKRLGTVANGTVLPSGRTSVTIRRGELNRLLRDAAEDAGIEVLAGRRLVAARTSSTGVEAEFEDGSTMQADLLIGADGIHSHLRRIIDPAAEQPRYSKLLSIGGRTRGVVPREAEPGTFNMMFGREAFFSYLPAAPGEVWWFANLPEPHEPPRGALAAIDDETWRERLLRTFDHDRGPASDLIQASDTPLGAYAIHDLPTVRTWSRGRMVLIGDAAHATSPSAGQGASMALESALELAVALRDAPGVLQALRAYERIRRPRVERVVRYSARLSGSKAAGPLARRFRDRAMPIALKHFAKPESHAWMYDHVIDLADNEVGGDMARDQG